MPNEITPISLLPKVSEFQLHEYDSVKEELLDQVKNLSAHFHYAIVVSAVLFSWLLTNKLDTQVGAPCSIVALFIPIFATGLFFVQTFAAFQRIDRASQYIKTNIELNFAPGGRGFEHSVKRKTSRIRKVLYINWAALAVFDLAAALVIFLHHYG